MEQRTVLSPREVIAIERVFTRAEIRAKLAKPRPTAVRGDVTTGLALLSAGDLQAYDSEKFGVLPSTGIPYTQGAGAPGVRVKHKPAAVLVLLVEQPDGLSMVLTKRTSELKHHPGQVAFPGGRLEPDDADMVACALRESEEEIGLARERVEILGQLDPYLTITGYEVTPVVGAIAPPVDFKPDPVEVADVFEVPFGFLMNPVNHRREQRMFKGLMRAYYAMPYRQHYIWGATAAMILNLSEIMNA